MEPSSPGPSAGARNTGGRDWWGKAEACRGLRVPSRLLPLSGSGAIQAPGTGDGDDLQSERGSKGHTASFLPDSGVTRSS